MKHVACPYCEATIPAERYRDGKVVIPEYLVCDVCGKRMELTEHNGSETEGMLHKIVEKLNQYEDGRAE